jgi:nucleoid-associated protein EbfC
MGRVRFASRGGRAERSNAECVKGEGPKPGARSPKPKNRCATLSSAHLEDPMNIQQMMKQAQQMQEKLQREMAEMRVEGTGGGGMVTVVINGSKQIQSITIDPEVVSKDDVEMLQDLIVAALNDAYRRADDEMQKSMGGMLGGMKIPGF